MDARFWLMGRKLSRAPGEWRFTRFLNEGGLYAGFFNDEKADCPCLDLAADFFRLWRPPRNRRKSRPGSGRNRATGFLWMSWRATGERRKWGTNRSG